MFGNWVIKPQKVCPHFQCTPRFHPGVRYITHTNTLNEGLMTLTSRRQGHSWEVLAGCPRLTDQVGFLGMVLGSSRTYSETDYYTLYFPHVWEYGGSKNLRYVIKCSGTFFNLLFSVSLYGFQIFRNFPNLNFLLRTSFCLK